MSVQYVTSMYGKAPSVFSMCQLLKWPMISTIQPRYVSYPI